MSRTCTICRHEDRADIDKALVARQPFRHIAERYEISTTSLVRHSDDHLPASLLKATDAAEIARADTILDQVQELRDKALDLLKQAEDAGDLRTALAGVREARACMEMLAKLAGELQDGATINILFQPQWLQIQGVILATLNDHPEARLAVADALTKIGMPDV